MMTSTWRCLFMIGVVLWTAAACSSKPPEKIDETRNYNATFVCDGAKVIKVSFIPFAAVLEIEGVSANLTQQPAADGLLYAGGGHSLRARGKEVTWTDNNGAGHQCLDRTAESGKSNPPSQ